MKAIIRGRITSLVSLICLTLIGGVTQYFAYNNMNQSFGSLNLVVFIIPLLISWAFFFIVQFINFKKLFQYKWLWIGLSIFIQLITLCNGISINGVKNWLSFGVFSINTGFWSMFFFALFLTSLKEEKARKNLIISKKITKLKTITEIILSVVLLYFLALNNDKQILIAIVTMIVIFFFCIGKKLWPALIVTVIALFIAGLIFIQSNHAQRIRTYFVDNSSTGKSYQADQCYKSIQIGGWTGIGFQPSKRVEKNRFLLPLPTSYTTYSVVIEQFGIVGGTIVVLLMSYFVYFGIMVYKRNKEISEAPIILLLLSIFILFNSVHILNCLGILSFGSILSFFSMGRDWNMISMILAGLIFKFGKINI